MAATIAASGRNSVNGCRTTDAIPSTVAIAPGPNISGIASGTNATLSGASAGAFGMMVAVAPDGMNSEKPIRIRMIPPTILTNAERHFEDLQKQRTEDQKEEQ